MSVSEFVQRFGSHWSDAEVEAAVWKLAGDAAAAGRLLVDLSEVELSLSTPLALLDPDAPPILPDSLPSSLAKEHTNDSYPHLQDEEDDTPLEIQVSFLGRPLMHLS